MKILIIGGTGLISTPLTAYLLDRGDDVTVYNRGQTTPHSPVRAARQGELNVLRGDRQQYASFEAEMRAAGHFDCVIDMVGYAPEDAVRVVRAFKGQIGQFIFCSTVDIYRKPATRYPYVEHEPYGGLNDYANNKVQCEQTLMAAHERGDFPVTILRPAYTYGEGRGLLNPVGPGDEYVARLRQGKPIIVHGDGSSFWVSCHCEDVARAFLAAAGNPVTFGKKYNTAGHEWLTWDQYHQQAAEAMGAPAPRLIHIPTDLLIQLDPKQTGGLADNFRFNNIFDNGAAARDLGWQPAITWKDGVRRVVAWLDANGKGGMPANAPTPAFDDRIASAWQAMERQVSGQIERH